MDYSNVEEAIADYCYAYGDAAYRLGYSDGVLAGMENGADGQKSVPSLKDMASLVCIYDAVRILNIIMLGGAELHLESNIMAWFVIGVILLFWVTLL